MEKDAGLGLLPTDEQIVEMYWQRDVEAIKATDKKYGSLQIKSQEAK